jgi:hypothetical protein
MRTNHHKLKAISVRNVLQLSTIHSSKKTIANCPPQFQKQLSTTHSFKKQLLTIHSSKKQCQLSTVPKTFHPQFQKQLSTIHSSQKTSIIYPQFQKNDCQLSTVPKNNCQLSYIPETGLYTVPSIHNG